MTIKSVLAVDGLDYAGKSEMCKVLARLFGVVGLRTIIINQPRHDTVYGRLARQLIAEGIQGKELIDALMQDQIDVLDSINKLEADVVILDRHLCSTATHQGDEGLEAVMNNPRLLRHNYGPEMFISVTCPYEEMVKRKKARFEKEGRAWDEIQSDTFTDTEENWNRMLERVDYVHRVVVGSGICAVREVVQGISPTQELKAMEIVRSTTEIWLARNAIQNSAA